MSNTPSNYVSWFRNSAPYINANRNKTIVLMISGQAIADAQITDIIHDIALLDSLGVRLVLVHGARPQINEKFDAQGLTSQFHNDIRITDEAEIACVKEAVGVARSKLEALLTMGVANSPMHGAKLSVCSGNFVIAKPVGIRDGIDFCYTGEVRRVDTGAINSQLDNGSIVLLPPIGYSLTGEIFNLSAEELASDVAMALKADKLILMCSEDGAVDAQGVLIQALSTYQAEQLLVAKSQSFEVQQLLKVASRACHAGIQRAHLVSYKQDGALLTELYTRDGFGTMITVESCEQIRTATIADVGGIIELISPLEEEGVLVRRSRQKLENEIDWFTVIEKDGAIIGCAAFYPFFDEKIGELAGVAVHPDYRNQARGEQLLNSIAEQAKKANMEKIAVLTTQTAHWFIERGFEQASIDALPAAKQQLYNWQRNSKVFIKTL
jgi:amino-acid N-acetyltransferase